MYFFRFLQIYVFYRCRKTGQIDFAEKRAPTKVKYLLPVCQILRYFTSGNARKFTVRFAFCAHVDIIKSRKTLMFSFERAQITWAFVLSARAIVKLLGATLNSFCMTCHHFSSEVLEFLTSCFSLIIHQFSKNSQEVDFIMRITRYCCRLARIFY